jgi:hypothetical protein
MSTGVPAAVVTVWVWVTVVTDALVGGPLALDAAAELVAVTPVELVAPNAAGTSASNSSSAMNSVRPDRDPVRRATGTATS